VKVLVIGHSRIARRRVLPALRSLRQVEAIAVASRTARGSDVAAGLEFHSDYEAALVQSRADLAYVSVANSDHARLAMRCLEAGMHVVVDKPACLKQAEAERLAALAAAKRRCLAEATVFAFHPQFDAFQQCFAHPAARASRVVALFSFPPLEPQDFRNRRELGGGALNDLGPYVAAASRLMFSNPPTSVDCRVLKRNPDGLETAFSVLLGYSDGGAFVGHFGFDTEYQNRLLAFGPGIAAEMQRAFTLPPDAPGRVAVRRNNVESVVDVPAADAFRNFLYTVVQAIEGGDTGRFTQDLIADATLRSELRRATGEL